jgi:hypothetical protein
MTTQLTISESAVAETGPSGANPLADDLYEVLGASKDAGWDDIRKAFRAAARKYHPDHNGNTPEMNERFAKIKDAYDVLSDPDKRDYYDDTGLRKPDQATIDKMATDLAHRLFNDAMAAATVIEDPGFNIETYDPVLNVCQSLDQSIENIAGMRAKWQRQIAGYESMKRRFKTRRGDGFKSTLVSHGGAIRYRGSSARPRVRE